MKAKVINEKEMDYGQALQVAINAIREAIPKAIAAEYDIRTERYADSHTQELADILSSLRELHTDVYTYNDPNAKKEVSKFDEEDEDGE